MIFPGLDAIDAAADNFASQEFGNSNIFSIQPDTEDTTNPVAANYSVMGGNKSGLEADMQEVAGGGSLPMITWFTKENFPFKYIGIKYVSGGASGEITFLWERKAQTTVLC